MRYDRIRKFEARKNLQRKYVCDISLKNRDKISFLRAVDFARPTTINRRTGESSKFREKEVSSENLFGKPINRSYKLAAWQMKFWSAAKNSSQIALPDFSRILTRTIQSNPRSSTRDETR